jgi:thiol-disulfide isomerase/thioredoxin
MIKYLDSVEEFNSKIAEIDKITVVVFRAEWCGDCHFIDSFMDEVVHDFSDSINFFNLDIEALGDIANSLSVVGIPSFVAFKGDKEITRFMSRQRKSESEIRNFLNEL